MLMSPGVTIRLPEASGRRRSLAKSMGCTKVLKTGVFLCVDEKQNVIAQAWMRNGKIEYCSSENLRELLRIKLEGWQL
jgi:hypothetical protein